jgi:hypothetical protein
MHIYYYSKEIAVYCQQTVHQCVLYQKIVVFAQCAASSISEDGDVNVTFPLAILIYEYNAQLQ